MKSAIQAWPWGLLAHDGLTSLLPFSFRSGTICLNQISAAFSAEMPAISGSLKKRMIPLLVFSMRFQSSPESLAMSWIIGRKGARALSSGGDQVFQLLTDFMGPLKFTLSISAGTPWWPEPSVLVQSQRRHRFLMTIIEGFWI